MTIRKICVPFQAEASGERAFRAARMLAAPFKAHIEAVHVRQRPTVPVSAYYPLAVAYVQENADLLREAEAKAATALKHRFAALASALSVAVAEQSAHRDAAGVTASWTEKEGALPFDLTALARSSDLVCLAQADGVAPFIEGDLIEEMLFQSGRPVFVAPVEGEPAPVEAAVIAWNGGREAARAAAAALPILERARSVAVVTVGEINPGAESASRFVDYLRLHGVAADATRIDPAPGQDAEAALLANASDIKAGLIVMGAYSHNRWRQLVLGGFTRKLLRETRIPLLMAH